jgi:magnesium-transporting ATPase (P-type)
VIAICVYTGVQTKIMLNSQKGNIKMSHLEHMLNSLVLNIVAISCMFGALMAGLSYYWMVDDNKFDDIITEPENTAS